MNQANGSIASCSPSARPRVRRSVLWIDDDLVPSDACVRLLTLAGYQVQCACTGGAGLEFGLRQRFDAILLDLRLPDMSGLAVLRALAAIRRTTPILIVSGYCDVLGVQIAADLGAAGLLTKPVHGDHLADSLDALICRTVPPDSTQGTVGQPPEAVFERAGGLHWRRSPELEFVVRRLLTHGEGKRSNTDSCLTVDLARVLIVPLVGIPEFVQLSAAFQMAVAAREAQALDILAGLLTRSGAALPTACSSLVSAAISLMECSPCRTGDVATSVAQRLDTSPSLLERRFQRETSMSLRRWHLAAIMRHAASALCREPEHVRQIAFRLGYQHASQFNREYLRFFSVSPTGFRLLVETGGSPLIKGLKS